MFIEGSRFSRRHSVVIASQMDRAYINNGQLLMQKTSPPTKYKELDIEEKILGDQRFLDLRTYFNFDFSIFFNSPATAQQEGSGTHSFKKFKKDQEKKKSELARAIFKTEKFLSPGKDIETHASFLMQLPKSHFNFELLSKHIRKFEGYAKSCINRKDANAQSLASIAVPALIQPLYHWSEALNDDQRKSLMLQFEELIHNINRVLPPATITSGSAEFKSYILFAYMVTAEILTHGLSSAILAYNLVYFRQQSVSTWANIHPRERLLFSVITLHIFLRFYNKSDSFSPKYGFSHNTFTDLHALMYDAYDACSSLGLITAGQVFMWIVERIESETLAYNDLAGGRRALKGLTPTETRSVVELVKRFSSYRIPVTVERVERFLAQFVTTGRIRAVLKLLNHLKFYPLWQLGEAMENMLRIESRSHGKIVVAPLGDRTGSTAIINYLISHSELTGIVFADDLAHAIRLTEAGDRIYFVDDCTLSGTQSIHIMQELMGERVLKPHHTKHCDTLSKTQQADVCKRTLVFTYCLACDTAINRMKDELSKLHDGKINFEIIYDIPEPSKSKAFTSASAVPWESQAERDDLKEYCSDAGYSILEKIAIDKGWNEERRLESSLGYSDFQRLLVFPYSVPKTTLPILWKEGDSGFRWTPLFPVLD